MTTPNQHKIWALHMENLALRKEADALRKKVRKLEGYERCGYCGRRSLLGRRTCTSHSDLPER